MVVNLSGATLKFVLTGVGSCTQAYWKCFVDCLREEQTGWEVNLAGNTQL